MDGAVLDDHQLISAVLNQDDTAQKLFYKRFERRLRVTCIHFLGFHDPEVEDLVQETFLRAFKHLDRFDFRGEIYSWLNKICVNLCFDRLRERQRFVVAEGSILESMTQASAMNASMERETDAIKEEALASIRRAFRDLGEKCQEVVRMRDFEGRPYLEIARILRLAPGTLFSRLARCRKALRRLVESGGAQGGTQGGAHD
jgi:RNA polymerase sigma-70 factor (ECF subfamily)